MKKILVLVFALFISFSANSSEKNLINKLYYSGFSFSGDFKDKSYAYRYFGKIGDKKIASFFLQIAKNLKPVHFDIISDPKANQLLELQNENANFLAFVINHEDFTEEQSGNTDVHAGFYEAYFQIMIYDSYNKNLVTSIPVNLHHRIEKNRKITSKDILDEIIELYLGKNQNVLDSSFYNAINAKIKNIKLKKSYKNTIGIKKITIENEAKQILPSYFSKNISAFENYVGQVFLSNVYNNHKLAFIPFKKGELIGRTVAMRFIDQKLVHEIILPDPDFHIYLTIRKFSKVLAEENSSEQLYYYASYIHVQLIQPEIYKISEKKKGLYFDENLRGVLKEKIPRTMLNVDDWRKYMNNYNELCKEFSKNLQIYDTKWAKLAHKNPSQLKKSLKVFSEKIKTMNY